MILLNGKEYNLSQDEIEMIIELDDKGFIEFDRTRGAPNTINTLLEKGIVRIAPSISSKYDLTTLGYMIVKELE